VRTAQKNLSALVYWRIVGKMSTSIEELAEQAMTLPVESRARLADLLVESLDTDELGRIEQLWIAEAKRRRDEVRSGRVKTIPGPEALQKVRDTLKR
jgi:hypothetical protein